MIHYKTILFLLISLLAFKSYGQRGPTTAGDHFTTAEGNNYAYTIGEVLNLHTVNGDNSNKLGILQPIKQMPLTVVDELKSTVNIFPNPAIDFINVTVENNGSFRYKIYNTEGMTVLSGNLSEGEIDLTNISQGGYYIVIENGTQFTSRKFQKFKGK